MVSENARVIFKLHFFTFMSKVSVDWCIMNESFYVTHEPWFIDLIHIKNIIEIAYLVYHSMVKTYRWIIFANSVWVTSQDVFQFLKIIKQF